MVRIIFFLLKFVFNIDRGSQNNLSYFILSLGAWLTTLKKMRNNVTVYDQHLKLFKIYQYCNHKLDKIKMPTEKYW